MPHRSGPTSRSPASRSSTRGGESFADDGLGGGGMATLAPDPHVPPPLGVRSGLPLIPCPECGAGLVEEYIPAEGLCEHCHEDAGVPGGGCSFFKTQEEYEAILRDRGLLGPAGATPEQGQGGCPHLTPGPSGFLVPVPVGNTKMAAAVEDLKHEMGALNLAIAQLAADISKGILGAGDKAQKVAKTDLVARWGKAIGKYFFEWFFVVVLLSGIVVAMFVK